VQRYHLATHETSKNQNYKSIEVLKTCKLIGKSAVTPKYIISDRLILTGVVKV